MTILYRDLQKNTRFLLRLLRFFYYQQRNQEKIDKKKLEEMATLLIYNLGFGTWLGPSKSYTYCKYNNMKYIICIIYPNNV